MRQQTSRRDFMKNVAATSAAVYVGHGLAFSKQALSANEEINVACIGIGGKGGSDSDNASQFGNVIAMCDVDHFKRFNDTYGHDVGDQVLKMVAAKLSQVGGGGRAFRYGGEEFLVVFRGRSAREAEPFVESLRRSMADAGFVLRGPDRPAGKPRLALETHQTSAPRVNISISIGLAERSKRHSTPELVLDAADAALYRAKQEGRNRVCVD